MSHPGTRRGEPAGRDGRLTAAGRVLAVLGAFAHGGGALSLTEVSRRAELPLTTTHRLIREVLDWGGLEVDRSGRYRLSAKFLELAAASTRGLGLRDRALPYLSDLHRRTGLTVHFAVRNDATVMNLEALRLHPNYGGENRIGGRLPLHVSAAGLVLLAYAPGTVVERYLERPLPQYTPRTIGDPERLRAALEEVRRERAVIARDTVIPGRATVAAPVHGADGEVEAAVSVICSSAGDAADRCLTSVRAAAERVSAVLARVDPPPSERAREFRRRHLEAL